MPCGFIFTVEMLCCIIEPERNVYSFDLVYVVLFGKNRRDEFSCFYIAFICFNRILFCFAEWDYIVRFEFAGKFLFYNNVIATEGTLCGSE